jgi:RimJ/RimL family protein N-acetyltransferase
MVMEQARSRGLHRFMHAFPSIHNAASNAVCRNLGFVLQQESDFEFPPGHWMRCNDWRLDLTRTTATGGSLPMS